MLSREEAYQIVSTWTENQNLIKHMLAVETAMLGLARKFQIPNDKLQIWGITGLLHDADYDKFPTEHPKKIIEELEKRGESTEIINAIKAHAWKYNGMDREPQNNLEWSIYCCDELTGLIVAVTLIRPTRKIKDVTVDDILKKWNKKDFAKGVERKNIELCEEKLGIKLNDFIQIVLSSMQSISDNLGL
mgnify:CR=1 FL=1